VIKLDQSLFTGLGFGATSGIITTLGLIVGLETLTNSIPTALAGIYIIAFADGLSDALGIHLSQESNKKIKSNEVWASTIYTLIFKILIALSFTIPLVLYPSIMGVIICILWGYLLLGLLSLIIAKRKEEKPYGIILEHWVIMTFILIVTYLIGTYVR
jgi:VIT1/CCC1 family predicted Fe2+/Mn2+ transporter